MLQNVVALATGNENIPRPRDATSVAIRMGERPALNSASTQSRSRLHRKMSANAHESYRRYSLFLVTVDGQCWPSILTEVLCDIVRNTFCADENEYLRVLLTDLVEVLNELRPLLKVTADLDNLLDVVVGRQLSRADVNLDEVLQEVLYAEKVSVCHQRRLYHAYVREFLDVLRPGSREHQRLSIGTNLSNDLPDLRLETHVKHTIRLVHDKVGDATKVGLLGLKHVDQPTRSGDHDLDTALQVTDLRTLGCTTVDSSVPDFGVCAKLGALLLNLDSELTSRRENERDGAIAGSKEGLSASE